MFLELLLLLLMLLLLLLWKIGSLKTAQSHLTQVDAQLRKTAYVGPNLYVRVFVFAGVAAVLVRGLLARLLFSIRAPIHTQISTTCRYLRHLFTRPSLFANFSSEIVSHFPRLQFKRFLRNPPLTRYFDVFIFLCFYVFIFLCCMLNPLVFLQK